MTNAHPAEVHRPVHRFAPWGTVSRTAVYAGRMISGLAIVFLLFDTALKVFQVRPAIENTVQLGYPESAVFAIGVIEIVCLIVYVIPRTSALGAVLWTGYLGGAVATHVRVGSPLISHTLFPIYIAMLIWAGLWLRDERVRALLSVSGPPRERSRNLERS